MRSAKALLAGGLMMMTSGLALADDAAKTPDADGGDAKAHSKPEELKAESQSSEGNLNIGGHHVDYQAVVGTLVVPPKDLDKADEDGDGKSDKPAPAQAAMSYVAYFKHGGRSEQRPLMFLYNGGPGSSTVWLHMGAFGPKRVVTADHTHTPAAPYGLVDNAYSLLDVADLVFIDAPATGFGKVIGKDKEKTFYGVDGDAKAFAEFITQFLGKYGRWNSPKYLFGESYGTTRSAAVARVLQEDHSVDLNGVILLSQILCFDASPDAPQFNPGVDLPYQLSLPTYAASAWYHKKLPEQPADLPAFLAEVEHFAMSDYAAALAAGNTLDATQKHATAEKLHHYTGLPVDYLEKANLRVNGGQFEKTLLDTSGESTGRLDTRFSGPSMDPLSEESDYDPQSAAIGSAYVSVFNDYVRKDLKFGADKTFKPFAALYKSWNYLHQPDGAPQPLPQATNVMPDLAAAMKYNPNLKIQLEAGYYDLATPFYEAVYELQHLPIPQKLQGNIEYRYYESGHMIYAHEPDLKSLHDNVADFVRRTDNVRDEKAGE
jgi:carboxypeptidase C (cathepsin A)